jgi:hypothetical protein
MQQDDDAKPGRLIRQLVGQCRKDEAVDDDAGFLGKSIQGVFGRPPGRIVPVRKLTGDFVNIYHPPKGPQPVDNPFVIEGSTRQPL